MASASASVRPAAAASSSSSSSNPTTWTVHSYKGYASVALALYGLLQLFYPIPLNDFES